MASGVFAAQDVPGYRLRPGTAFPPYALLPQCNLPWLKRFFPAAVLFAFPRVFVYCLLGKQ